MAESEDLSVNWGRLESAIISSFRHFRERYLPSLRRRNSSEEVTGKEDFSLLQCLPVDMQLYIMSYVSPRDLCQLGCTNNYWYLMVRDPVLWRYFLLRDLPSWPSVDWTSLPSAEQLKTCCAKESDGVLPDYMSIYLKSSPGHRKCMKLSRPKYAAVTSFLHSLVANVEPRFAMFGPGLEQLDDSLVRRMMTSPELLPVAGFPQRQINGIGSGITFLYNTHHRFNILTLYSTTSKERERARTDNNTAVNKIFVPESSTSDSSHPVQYRIIPHVEQVCRIVDGFIYVANAEARKKHQRPDEIAHIMAMTDQSLGLVNRPFLVLSCITHDEVKRIPCIYVAHELGLNLLNRPWLVQNTTATSLSGLLDGIEWLLEELGIIT